MKKNRYRRAFGKLASKFVKQYHRRFNAEKILVQDLTQAGCDNVRDGNVFPENPLPWHSTFFGHLTLEKLLKALFVSRTDKTPQTIEQ
ncbi:MAG: hypothetical protein U9R02_06405 [Thermodesulfobacteriota bacterium]|nr:hypothetical protein [Thermodesulfobacteriota bacterium]